jgi:uncharacterized repeat protein (TIGR03803 family)
MNPKRQPFYRALILVLFFVASLVRCATARDSGEHVIYHFQGGTDGYGPVSSLISDPVGNFYGTTEYGGGSFYGTVFELSPPQQLGGEYVETILYSFTNTGDGARPTAALLRDNAGNLYGTTSDSNAGGDGEVFRLSPPIQSGGVWTESILYRFQGGTDGSSPNAALITDGRGNLYGTATSSVFELSPPQNRGTPWTFTLLHEFKCCTSDGWNAVAPLVIDPEGNLYGTTEWGGDLSNDSCGSPGCGTVFEVSPPSHAVHAWAEKVIHTFTAGDDGFDPLTGLSLDVSGNLYGTTYSGGTGGGGTAFELSAPASGRGDWTHTVIHNFTYSGTQDGAVPSAMILDSSGSLFGTTRFGGYQCAYNGAYYGYGTVFELRNQHGVWNERILYFFHHGGVAARQPAAGLIIDDAGNLFGTTEEGGYAQCYNGYSFCGTVYQIGTRK